MYETMYILNVYKRRPNNECKMRRIFTENGSFIEVKTTSDQIVKKRKYLHEDHSTNFFERNRDPIFPKDATKRKPSKYLNVK